MNLFNYLKRDETFYRRVFRIAFPLLMQNLLVNIMAMVDSTIVGSVGEDALAALTTANIPITVLEQFFFGATAGVTILVSQFWGKGDRKKTVDAVGIGMLMALVTTTFFTLIVFLFNKQFMSFFGNDPHIVSMAGDYCRYIAVSYFFASVDNIYLAMLPATERTVFCSAVNIGSMLLRMALSFTFTRLPATNKGLRGIGLAMLVSKGIEFLVVAAHMHLNKQLSFGFGAVFRPDTAMISVFIASAGTVIVNETIWGMGVSVITNTMSHLENSALVLSAYSVANSIMQLANAFSRTMSSVCSVIIGTEVGSERPKKSIQEQSICLGMIAFFVGIFAGTVILTINSTGLSNIYKAAFGLSESAYVICKRILYVLGTIFPLRILANALTIGVLRGGGDVRRAALIDILPLWVGAVPWALLCGNVFRTDAQIVVLAYGIQYVIQNAMAISRLKGGEWMKPIQSN